MLDLSMMGLFLLGELWGLKTVNEVIGEIAKLDDGSDDFSFDKLIKFDQIIQSLANAVDENPRQIKDREIMKLPIGEMMTLFKSFSVMMVAAVQTDTTPDLGKQTAVPKEKKK